METVAPLFTALIALSMAVSTLLRSSQDPLNRAYALMAGSIAVIFLSLFALILTKDQPWRYALLASALLVAPTSFGVYQQLLSPLGRSFRGIIGALLLGAIVQLGVIAWFGSQSRVTITSNALLVFGGLGLHWLWVTRLGRRLNLEAERRRLRYLLWAGGAAILLIALEMALLDWNVWAGQTGSPFLLPPFGSLATAAYVYLMGSVISSRRMLDRSEIVVRFAVFVGLTTVLSALYAVVARLISPRTGPFAEGLNILLATILLLILYEPLKDQIEERVGRVFARERADWLRELAELKRRLPGLIEEEPLVAALLDGSTLQGRVDLATIYLIDEDRGFYRLRGREGHPEQDPLSAIPHRPFVDGFLEGRPWYELTALESEAIDRPGVPRPDWIESVVATMQGMQAELCVPLQIGASVVGVWGLRTHPGAAAFSTIELRALHDIADQLAVALDNSQAFERAKERDRLAALGEMSAGLAHEIRNPLGAIKGAVQVLGRRELAELDREFLGIIVEEVDRLNGVVSQFLDYARPMNVHAHDVLPDTLMQGIMSLVVAEGLPPGVHIDYVPGVDLPAVSMDIEKLKQVALNVLRNGVESMHERGGTLTVRTRVGARGAGSTQASMRALAPGHLVQVKRGGVQTPEYLEFSFEDQGAGITEDEARKLFIPFFTTKATGTGLGLPICERIMRAHGGEIEIRSRPGRGTRFALRLPLEPPPPLEEPETVVPDPDPDAAATLEEPITAPRRDPDRRTTEPLARFPKSGG